MSKFEKFEMQVVHRSQLVGADYNPRVISNQAKARLRRGIEEVGLVQPVIWNKRSGRIVGGHQRVDSLDQLEGSADYTLNVAVVDLDDRTEKRINTLLNNDGAMGHWDERKLLELFAGEDPAGIDYAAYGFSANQGEYYTNLIQAQDLENEQVVAAMSDAIAFETDVNVAETTGVEERLAKKIERKSTFESKVHELLVPQDNEAWKLKTDEEKKAYDNARNNFRDNNDYAYSYLKIAFSSEESKRRFLRSLNLNEDAESIHESDLAGAAGPQAGSGADAAAHYDAESALRYAAAEHTREESRDAGSAGSEEGDGGGT